MEAIYRRVLIKISGEALAGEKKTGFDFAFVTRVCETVKRAAEAGVQVGIVIGGGNFWRGVKDGAGKVERVSADRMGMLATCMNCLAVCDVLRQLGAKARVMTAVDIQGVGERYDTRRAIEYLQQGKVVLFGCGTGMPFFSTDTAAVLRAAEIHADAILLAKNIDGVYSADRMGMLATAMNGLALADVFAQCGVKARLLTAVDIQGVGERYDTKKAIEYMEAGEIVLFAGGSGAPFFSTDTAAVLRAAEIHADAILLAKNIDGVYSDDPRKNPDAVKFDRISYDEVLARHLAVMDTTATSLAMDNFIPVLVFALAEPENILRVLGGEEIGTLVK